MKKDNRPRRGPVAPFLLSTFTIADNNKADKYYTKIRNAMANRKEKLGPITLAKCTVQDGILFHKDRL